MLLYTMKNVAVMVTITGALMSLVIAVPVSQSRQLMLQVQPELLRGHKLILTLEPLSTAAAEGKVNEVQVQQLSVNAKILGAEEDEEEEEITTTYSSADENATTPLTMAVEEEEEPATEAIYANPASAIMVKGGVRNKDVNQFLFHFPGVKCPEGQRPDSSGICRELFQPNFKGRKNLGRYFLPLHAHRRQTTLDDADGDDNRVVLDFSKVLPGKKTFVASQ